MRHHKDKMQENPSLNIERIQTLKFNKYPYIVYGLRIDRRMAVQSVINKSVKMQCIQFMTKAVIDLNYGGNQRTKNL